MRHLWQMAEKMKVLYEDNHVLCIEKPVNIPVQADRTGDLDMLTMCREYLREKYHKPGNVFVGLVHRLDRPVGGCMIFARTGKAASRLSEAVRAHQIIKEYVAVLDGVPAEQEGILEDWLIKDTRTNTVRVTQDRSRGKYAKLSYRILAVHGHLTLVHIHLYTGRPHQIRVQFASRCTPLLHDQRYHPHPSKGQIALWAVRLSFPQPVSHETITVTDLPGGGFWHGFEVKL